MFVEVIYLSSFHRSCKHISTDYVTNRLRQSFCDKVSLTFFFVRCDLIAKVSVTNNLGQRNIARVNLH